MLAQNRRLRHLQGLYLRNLTLTRPRNTSADDLEADLLLAKAAKLDALPEHSPPSTAATASGPGHAPPVLHHSQLSESLRPRPNTLRRRSTTLQGASPLTRQRQLEHAVDSRAADVFFSLHCEGYDEPVYISELAERSVNTNFAFFDLSAAGPSVTRQAELKIKIWARRHGSWSLVLAQHVDLRSLNYLDTLRNRHFPPNCLVFHLLDGMYCLDLSSKRPNPKQQPPLPTSSYNALMKLSNLENSIQDALATRERLTAQINAILDKTPTDPVPEAQEAVERAASYVSSQKRAVNTAQKRKDQLQSSIAARREAMLSGQSAQVTASSDVKHAESRLPSSITSLGAIRESIHGQRHRICEDLSAIFAITPDPSGTPLSFRICGIPVPNTDYDPTSSSASDDSLSAALGYVAQLVNALQFYLSVPLPYPISPFGSRSSIRDDISVIPEAQRQFPLFLRGGATAQYRFDYAWFLLNKDIETLCASAGLKVVDIRHTLPNLKYLLYVCSAGTDEVPERKRGGVRGLWAGRMKNRLGTNGPGNLTLGTAGSNSGGTVGGRGGARSPGLSGIIKDNDTNSSVDGGSRRGSIDSDMGSAAAQAETLRQAVVGGDGNSTGGNNSGSGGMGSALSSLGFGISKSGDRNQVRDRDSPVNGGGGGGDGNGKWQQQQHDEGGRSLSSSLQSTQQSMQQSIQQSGGGGGVGGKQGVAAQLSTSPPMIIDLPFTDGAPMTLRTKGLRENVGA